MAKYIAIALVLIGLAIGLRGLYVWTHCGYDCPAISYPSLTATGAILVAALAAAIDFGTLIAIFLVGLSKRG